MTGDNSLRRASIPTYIWTVIHMLSMNSCWSWRWYIIVIRMVTMSIYVIHWDSLSLHRITSSARYAIIQLHIVILCIQWRNIRDSRTIYWIVHGTWTWWVGAFRQANLGNVIRKFRGIVPTQTAHLSGNFTHLCGNSTISLKIAVNPCSVRVYQGWNRGIRYHFVAESGHSLVNQRFRHGDTGDT